LKKCLKNKLEMSLMDNKNKIALLAFDDVYSETALKEFIKKNHRKIKLVAVSQIKGGLMENIVKTVKRFGLKYFMLRGFQIVVRGRRKGFFYNVCKENGIECFYVDDENESLLWKKIQGWNGVVLSVGFNRVIPSAVVESFKGYNVHRSLLPAYKGSNPVLRALKNREKWVGVSLHRLSSKVDGGEVIAQKRIRVLEGESVFCLYERLAVETSLLLEENERACLL